MGTIKEALEQYLENPENILSTPGGRFTAEDFKLLMSAVTGTLDNFIIFSNGGGKPFMIWKMNEKDSYSLIKHLSRYTYMYKLNGVETIVKKLPNY